MGSEDAGCEGWQPPRFTPKQQEVAGPAAALRPAPLGYRSMRSIRALGAGSRGAAPRALARAGAVATLAAFLLAQSWLVCLPLCAVGRHRAMSVAGPPQEMHTATCHRGVTNRHEMPGASLLGAMLPTPRPPALPPAAIGSLPPATAPTLHPHQLPASDPPPPRSA